uniref:Ubiquitin-like domain-containing protein n=1 Tax=Ditylenchus dipsaci TaxID=166011 RepID=A0A915EB35_9BILA
MHSILGEPDKSNGLRGLVISLKIDDNPLQELYFEVIRKKTHFFVQISGTSTVADLKKMIEGALKVGSEKQVLKKPSNSKLSRWTKLEDSWTLQQAGFDSESDALPHLG